MTQQTPGYAELVLYAAHWVAQHSSTGSSNHKEAMDDAIHDAVEQGRREYGFTEADTTKDIITMYRRLVTDTLEEEDA